MTTLQIVGRQSSHYTRMTRIFAEELGVPYALMPVYDIATTDPANFGENPALKVPVLKTERGVLVGAQNICRSIADRAPTPRRVVWPEALRDELSCNAQELVWHGMATQVQLVLGTVINGLPADNAFFVKARAGFEGSLAWLDTNLAAMLAGLPPRDLSLFEVSLFCLVEHLVFRETLPVAPYPSLVAFSRRFGERASAVRTTYKFDVKPSDPAAA